MATDSTDRTVRLWVRRTAAPWAARCPGTAAGCTRCTRCTRWPRCRCATGGCCWPVAAGTAGAAMGPITSGTPGERPADRIHRRGGRAAQQLPTGPRSTILSQVRVNRSPATPTPTTIAAALFLLFGADREQTDAALAEAGPRRDGRSAGSDGVRHRRRMLSRTAAVNATSCSTVPCCAMRRTA